MMSVNDAKQHARSVYVEFKKSATDVTNEQEWLRFLKQSYDDDQAKWKPLLRMSDEEKVMGLGRDVWKEDNLSRARRSSQMELPLVLHGHVVEDFYTVPDETSASRTGRVFRPHATLRHWQASLKMRRADWKQEGQGLDEEEASFKKAVREAGGNLNTLLVDLAKELPRDDAA